MFSQHFSSTMLLATLLLLCGAVSGEWTPARCPSGCVCHEMLVDSVKDQLNAVDCQDRDMVTLDDVPSDAEAMKLSGNQLNMNAICRQNLSRIVYIDISRNQLKLHQINSLRVFFSQLQSLKALDLSNNYLETIEAALFKELKSLEFLSLSANAIVHIEKDAFGSLTQLRTLKLDDNQLNRIDADWFANFSSLRSLDLTSNRLESIADGDLTPHKLLERLKIGKNNISYIDDEAFTNLTIRELDLKSNMLAQVPNNALLRLPYLTILNLNNNPIENLNLSNHQLLKHVSVSRMPNLRMIHRLSFTNLSSLIKVDLYDNSKLTFVHPQAFFNCPSLQYLYLHDNQLAALEEAITASLPSLLELSLYNNRIECNCWSLWLTNTSINIIDGDKIVCYGPHAVKMATLYELTETQLLRNCLPIVLLEGDNHITADFNTGVHLVCESVGSVSQRWLDPLQKEINGTVDGRLTLREVKDRDEGVYTCVATSSAGETDSASVYVKVIHSKVILSTTTISKSFIALEWTEIEGPSVLSYVDVNGVTQEAHLPSGIRTYTLEKLHPDTSYAICIIYHHRLQQSCITVHMLPARRSDAPGEDNSVIESHSSSSFHGLLAVFAIFGVVVVFIAIIVVVYKKYQRNRRSKITYLRQSNEACSPAERNGHITLDYCYNPTTVPLCENELT